MGPFYRGADKSLAPPGKKQATATEDGCTSFAAGLPNMRPVGLMLPTVLPVTFGEKKIIF